MSQQQTSTRPRNTQGPQQSPQQGGGMTHQPQQHAPPAPIYAPRLPYHPALQERFGIDVTAFRALVDAVFPTATSTDSVFLALAYCKARGLDPFKRCIHIVPIWSKEEKRMVDTIWPGIGELRTTAFRTGMYAGKDETQFGPDIEQVVGKVPMKFPEWAQVTVYRLMNGVRVPFVGPKVRWLETYATARRDDDSPNTMWCDRPYGQIDKCAEAAALRTAFPEEIGGDLINDEVQGRTTLDSALSKAPVVITGQSRSDSMVDMLQQGRAASSHVEEEQGEQPQTSEQSAPDESDIQQEQTSQTQSDAEIARLTIVRIGTIIKPDELNPIYEDSFQLPEDLGNQVRAAVDARRAEIAKFNKAQSGGDKKQKTLTP